MAAVILCYCMALISHRCSATVLLMRQFKYNAHLRKVTNQSRGGLRGHFATLFGASGHRLIAFGVDICLEVLSSARRKRDASRARCCYFRSPPRRLRITAHSTPDSPGSFSARHAPDDARVAALREAVRRRCGPKL